MKSQPKELIQDSKWWENHNYGIAWYATHKAENINTKEKRYFIAEHITQKEIKRLLGSDWMVFSI